MEKVNWVDQKGFKATFGIATTNNKDNFIPNYVQRDPSEPPMLHKFREEDKKSWVGGRIKF